MAMILNQNFWKHKKVLLTGHTGFKGSWLCHVLDALGAKVYGLALAPEGARSMFESTGVARFIDHKIGDVNDLAAVKERFIKVQPDILFHFAAQPLVRRSYKEPVLTAMSNVMGTVHVCEAMRSVSSLQSAVMITTDKVYENNEWVWPYREQDPLGGHDPYSASKACSDLMISSYRASFYQKGLHGYPRCPLASARAGNVIGGGDWSEDRLIPDMMRAVYNKQTLVIRSPHSIRPWQHVLEPLYGYLLLAEKQTEKESFSQSWNFGPEIIDCRPVGDILTAAKDFFGSELDIRYETGDHHPHEAGVLRLDCTKAKTQLGWFPRWDLANSLEKTWQWYQEGLKRPKDLAEVTRNQVTQYFF